MLGRLVQIKDGGQELRSRGGTKGDEDEVMEGDALL